MRSALAAFAMLLLMASPGWADGPDDSPWTPAEDWAWAQVAAGRVANFDDRCGASTVKSADDAIWNDPCREVRGAALEQMLTRAPWRDQMQHYGLRIVGARITSGIDLSDAHITPAVMVVRSRIEGSFVLSHAWLENLLILDGSRVTGTIDATALRIDSDVFLSNGATLQNTGGATGALEAQQAVILRKARILGSLYLNGGRFDAMVDLHLAGVAEEVQTSGAHFKGVMFAGGLHAGVLSINATHFDTGALFQGSTFDLVDASDSTFGGTGLGLQDTHIANDVFISKLHATSAVTMTGARVGGFVTLEHSNISGRFNADGAQITGDVLLDDSVRVGGSFTLAGAQVAGSLRMSKVPFAGDADFDNAHVVGDMLLDGAVFSRSLSMKSVRADGNLTLTGATVTGDLWASDIDVRHDIAFDKHAMFHGQVQLFDGRVENTVHMEQSTFEKGLVAGNAQIGGDLLLKQAVFDEPALLSGARIGGDLNLSGTSMTLLDLTGATVRGSLVVNAQTAWMAPPDRNAPQLVLVNATVGGIQDDPIGKLGTCPTDDTPPRAPNGWPTGRNIELDGFTYNHLGAMAGQAGNDMRERDLCWWRWWLARDPTFSSQTYLQLASVMAAHGDPDNAAAIQYYGRVRETQMAWEAGKYQSWLLLAMLNLATGYGLGTYTFRAFWWIVALTGVGVLLLTWSPGAGNKGVVWRIGASLTRLLPGVELNREFTDFFDDPERKRLKDWQVAVFSAFVVIGWVLGLFLVAAMTGLTQHS